VLPQCHAVQAALGQKVLQVSHIGWASDDRKNWRPRRALCDASIGETAGTAAPHDADPAGTPSGALSAGGGREPMRGTKPDRYLNTPGRRLPRAQPADWPH